MVSIYQTSEGWFWLVTGFLRAVGPFKTLKDTYDDCHSVMGVD